jgi:ribosomal protein S18 acetylase RimI-like enzyme
VKGFVVRDASPAELPAVRQLLVEYAESLGFSLCFEGFDQELAGLPGSYSPPRGCLLVVAAGDRLVGCVALRPVNDDVCEMKRLFLRPAWRRAGAGRQLVLELMRRARAAGYRTMRLHTLPVMASAVALYRVLGFREIPPYDPDPPAGALFFEVELVPIPEQRR